MRSGIRLLASAAVVLLLVACGNRPATSTKQPPDSSAQVSNSRAIAPGERVALSSGLALTVPQGWDATMTAYPKPSTPLQASEHLLLDSPDTVDSPRVVMVFSSKARQLSVAALGDYARESFRPGPTFGNTSILVSDKPQLTGNHMMVALTQRTGGDLGVIYFGGDGSQPRSSFEQVAKLLALEGL